MSLGDPSRAPRNCSHQTRLTMKGQEPMLKQTATKKTTVVTDGDGTLYPFWEYFVPAMRSIIPVLAAKLSAKLGRKLTLDDVSHRIAFVMKVCGTHEYPWVWECSEFWQDPTM